MFNFGICLERHCKEHDEHLMMSVAASVEVAGLSPQRMEFNPKPVYVEFVVDKMAVGQVFLQIFGFSPVSTIPPNFRAHLFSHHQNCVALSVHDTIK
jgi:hypothetical protein